MKVLTTKLPGVVIIEPEVFTDRRGFFLETFRADSYASAAGIEEPFVQDNHSRSVRGVLRGLHQQVGVPQGKLVRATSGAVFDVAVDTTPSSPTFSQWIGVELSDTNHRQMYIPPGYAHGFCVLSNEADIAYKCTAYYEPASEVGIAWNDPIIKIDWPIDKPLLSARDRENGTLEEFAADAS